MTATARVEPPLNRFHLKITALTFGANFSDGYALGSIGVALTAIAPQMHLGSVWQGIIGASVLVGIFFGAMISGRIGDLFGRRLVYMLDFVLIVVASALQFFVHEPYLLLALRLVIGFGIGADYALGPTLVTEFVPARARGALLALLTVLWTVGYVVAFILGSLIVDETGSGWRWLLASGAIPAIVVLLLRLGVPESPQWLIEQGRIDEAQEVANRFLDGHLDYDVTAVGKDTATRGLRDLWAPEHRNNTIFGVVFYNAQVIPYFAIYTFLPILLPKIGLDDASTFGGIVSNLMLLVGGIVGLWFIVRYPRRQVTIWSFGILAVTLSVVAFGSGLPTWFVMIFFLIFTAVMSGATNLDQVYPPELYPTALRATGVGFQNAISRIGSALGTFLLPVALDNLGLEWSMAMMVAILLVGAAVSIKLAPETSHLGVHEVGGGH